MKNLSLQHILYIGLLSLSICNTPVHTHWFSTVQKYTTATLQRISKNPYTTGLVISGALLTYAALHYGIRHGILSLEQAFINAYIPEPRERLINKFYSEHVAQPGTRLEVYNLYTHNNLLSAATHHTIRTALDSHIPTVIFLNIVSDENNKESCNAIGTATYSYTGKYHSYWEVVPSYWDAHPPELDLEDNLS